MSTDILVVDVETTGTDPRVHGLLEIGASPLWPRPIDCDFQKGCVPFPGATWDAGAERVNGISQKDWELKNGDERSLLDTFLLHVQMRYGDRVMLAGMNPSFDLGFLRALAERVDGNAERIDRYFGHRTLDMHSLAIAHALRHGLMVPPSGYTSSQIYGLVGMDPETSPHRALVGARYEVRAMRRLLDLAKTDVEVPA